MDPKTVTSVVDVIKGLGFIGMLTGILIGIMRPKALWVPGWMFTQVCDRLTAAEMLSKSLVDQNKELLAIIADSVTEEKRRYDWDKRRDRRANDH